MRPAPNAYRSSLVRQALTLAVGCLGLIWGIAVLPGSEVADDFRDIEGRLLRFDTFSRTSVTQALESQASGDLSACDSHSQRAMLLLEMPLAEAALRSGAAKEFDRRIQSLESRSRQLLGCAPRESLVWLLMFNLEILHGRLSQPSFDLLAMSYQTSPNEAWVSIRRTIVAMPLLMIAPEPLRQRILFEFQQLVRFGFIDDAARSYLTASEAVRALLQTRIEQFELPRQKAFSNALEKLRS